MLICNYIGVFLTFRCQLGCSYCINKQGGLKPRRELSSHDWCAILKDIQTREDLPITLQGGEPTLYKDFYHLVRALHYAGKKIDLLTNGYFDVHEFMDKTDPDMFRRQAPYASIRFSYHQNTEPLKLLSHVHALQRRGYSVGIWGLDHPDMEKANAQVARECRALGIDYREKEFLDATHGTYKYPAGVSGKRVGRVKCYPSEMLYAPDGKLYPCHHFLYSGVEHHGPECRDYGRCNFCDLKMKTDRFQKGGHCSVRIEEMCQYCGEDPATCICDE